jgi:hypothetical protein
MIVYCRCKYARVIPQNVKDSVLRQLVDAKTPFEAVPDLCDMAARSDPDLVRFGEQDDLRIAACYPRTVVNLFQAAGAPLRPGHYCIANMREQTAAEIVQVLRGTRQEQGANR